MAADAHGRKAVHGHAAIALDLGSLCCLGAEIVWYFIPWRLKLKTF